MDVITRLRQQMRRGSVSTTPTNPKIPLVEISNDVHADDGNSDKDEFLNSVDENSVPVKSGGSAGFVARFRNAPTPGVFSKPAMSEAPLQPAKTSIQEPESSPKVLQSQAAEIPSNSGDQVSDGSGATVKPKVPAIDRLRKIMKETEDIQSGKKEIASIRALTRLLEAVYRKPGSSAPSEERIIALRSLVVQADSVAQAVAVAFGQDQQKSYVMAQAMEAVVGLVGSAWERDDNIDWPDVIAEAGADPLIITAAEAMGTLAYRQVDSPAVAAERLGISMHGSYWSVYMLGEDVDGITVDVASHVAREIAKYVQSSSSGISNSDLNVAWMQGAIRRITDLFCAEIRARFTDQQAPNTAQIDEAIKVAQEGFEGVEIHAKKLLEVCRSGQLRPDSLDAPARPIG